MAGTLSKLVLIETNAAWEGMVEDSGTLSYQADQADEADKAIKPIYDLSFSSLIHKFIHRRFHTFHKAVPTELEKCREVPNSYRVDAQNTLNILIHTYTFTPYTLHI